MKNSDNQSPSSPGKSDGKLGVVLGLIPPAFLTAEILFLPLKAEVWVLGWLVAGGVVSAACCSVVANLLRRRKTIWPATVLFLTILDGGIAIYLGVLVFATAYNLW